MTVNSSVCILLVVVKHPLFTPPFFPSTKNPVCRCISVVASDIGFCVQCKKASCKTPFKKPSCRSTPRGPVCTLPFRSLCLGQRIPEGKPNPSYTFFTVIYLKITVYLTPKLYQTYRYDRERFGTVGVNF